MAKHTRQGNLGYIIFDESDFGGGLVPQGQFSSTSIKQTKYQGMAGLAGIDPFRNIGILQPGMAPVNATNATTALAGEVIAGVFDTSSNSQIYGLDIGGRLQQINFITNTISTGGTFPHTITGSSPVGQDAIVYQHNSGSTTTQVYSVFYSYYNTTDWNVGALVNMTGTPDDDFMSTVPTQPSGLGTVDTNGTTTLAGTGTKFLEELNVGDTILVSGETVRTIATITSNTSLTVTAAFSTSASGLSFTYFPNAERTSPHPMCVGADGILYIGSGRYLHAYDGATGTNGTFIPRILTFSAGIQIQGMVKYNDFLYIMVNYASSTITGGIPTAGSSAVYIWNYLDEVVTQIIPINEPYASSIFIWRGMPTVTAYGAIERNGYVKIKHLVGNQAQKVADLPSSTSPVLRGIDSRQDTLYLNIGGQIISVGDRFSLGQNNYDINYIGYATFLNNSGWIYNLQTSSTTPAILVSSAQSTNYAFSKLTGGYATSSAITQFYEPDFPVLKWGRVKSISVYFYQPVLLSVSNPAFTLLLYTDYGSSTQIISGSQSLAAPLIKKYLEDTSNNPLPFFTSVGLQFIWASGGSSASATHQISKVIVEYELEEYQQ